ncbi:MAG: chemotaxis protein CheB [Bacteroidota bacterium]
MKKSKDIQKNSAGFKESAHAKEVEFQGAEKSRGFNIVGVGASAGGLEALASFFGSMPANTGMAFVVVQHLSPDYKSLMVELLSRHTKMNVYRAEDGMEVQPDSVYLIPPKKNMTIFHGKLYLSEHSHDMGLNLPIDKFLRSLAEDMGEKSIAVILSGTGSDGTLGIRDIKGAGGMTMAQDEITAKFDGMPKSAVATGLVDFVLPPDKMAGQLINYAKHPLVSRNESSEEIFKDNKDIYSKILALIRSRTGADFTFYKSSTIVRRIERRLSINQINQLENYHKLLQNSNSEIDTLYKELLIGVTKFFRDWEVFITIRDEIIPDLIQSKKPGGQIRIWVAGCSTGEEAYTLALLFRDYMDRIDVNRELKIFATDIDEDSIEFASAGIYPNSIIADVPEELLQKYFTKQGNNYHVNEQIRQMVIFARHSIIKDPPFSKMDMVSCRNLLIYLQPILQNKVLKAFSFSLLQNGYLVLGTSESAGEMASNFVTINNKLKIYQSRQKARSQNLNNVFTPYFKFDNKLKIKKSGKAISDRTNNISEEAIDSIEIINSHLFNNYVPPAIVIDEHSTILHAFNDANKYLRLPKGEVNLNLMNMIHPELSVAISTAIHKAIKEKNLVRYRNLNIEIDGSRQLVTLTIKYIGQYKNSDNCLLVVFEKGTQQLKPISREDGDSSFDGDSGQRIEDLEQELKYNKENLQATLEELETSNEELQSTNEELIASNEELQTTNEELQSVNEELYTVNSEYQSKIDELTELNNDINNWFFITGIGTVFLDMNLKVRKFTDPVTEFINLIDSDIGRPIKHISLNFEYDNFFNDIEEVLRNLKSKELEVKNKNNSWVLIKLSPYRTTENAVKGVVISFVDITRLKSYQEEIIREKDLLIRVLENSPYAKLMIDKDGFIIFSNNKSAEILGLSKENIQRKKFNDPDWRIKDADGNLLPEEKLPFRLVMDSGKPVYNATHYIEWPDGKQVKLLINGAPVFDKEGNVNGGVFSFSQDQT